MTSYGDGMVERVKALGRVDLVLDTVGGALRSRTASSRRTSPSSTWASADALACELVCLPRPLERSPRPDGGPLVYRVVHTARAWKAGERPALEARVLEAVDGIDEESAPTSPKTRVSPATFASSRTRGAMTATKREQAPTTGGPMSIALGFGFAQYFHLAAAGFVGTIPVASWLVSLVTLAGDPPTPPGAAGAWMGGALVALAFSILVVAPPLVPCLVLRARQPRGACIAWDDEGIVEREGAWRRTSIPWKNAEAARVTWDVPTRFGTRPCIAVQIVDRTTNEVITAWEDRPPGAPVVRRRLISSKTPVLADALERKGVRFTRPADWSRLAGAERVRPSRAVLALTRVGYVGGALAPLAAFPFPVLGVAVGAASSILLAWRAQSSVAEALALRARLRPRAVDADAPAQGPYRTGPRATDDDAWAAKSSRLRAVTIEVAVRAACAVLPVAASLANALRVAR